MSHTIKPLTILHSNDMHGDFLAEKIDDRLVGGVARLSGYLNHVRQSTPNTLYMVAGDMFRGSIIDSEFQGVSTIEIMNALAPDVASLGNHEVDYGIAHLLFLEKCCKFPIVCSNMYIKTNGLRLFNSHKILHVDDMNILVIGIVTEEIMARSQKDMLLGTFVNIHEAAQDVGVIVNSYKGTDIDFTILLTHIGFENDKALAAALDPAWGVDVIIGGHSHTLPEKPECINDVLIVQAGVGTDQIGRFDLEIDTDTNSVHSYRWQTIPIDDKHCPCNAALENLILNYKKITDEKYGVILTTLTEQATHPNRYQETTAGNLIADCLRESFGLDLVMIGSGSLRAPTLGPIVTRGNLLDMYAYPEKLMRVVLTGAEIKRALSVVLSRTKNDGTSHGEYYQLSGGWNFTYSRTKGELIEASYKNVLIKDDALFQVGIEGYHIDNLEKFMGLNAHMLNERAPFKTVTGNISTALEEHFIAHGCMIPRLAGRTALID